MQKKKRIVASSIITFICSLELCGLIDRVGKEGVVVVGVVCGLEEVVGGGGGER